MRKFSKKNWACFGINTVLFVIGLVLVTLGLVIELVLVPAQTKHKAKQQVVIKMDSSGKNGLNEFTNDWLHQNYSVYMEYWFYNYTNTYSIVYGGVYPYVVEKGPYSYRETITYNYKLSDSFSPDGNSFTYTKTRKYDFDPETSCWNCYENDTFILPDIIFFDFGDILLSPEGFFDMILPIELKQYLFERGADFADPSSVDKILQKIEKFKHVSFANILQEIAELFALLLSAYGSGPFLRIKVHEILWDGYDDPIFSKLFADINKILHNLPIPLNISLPTETPKISLNNRISTSLDYTVNTGVKNYKLTGTMVQYNNSDVLPSGIGDSANWWGTFDCNSTCEQPLFFDKINYTIAPENSDNGLNCECQTCTNETAHLASAMQGTNGDYFHAVIEKSEVLGTFSVDICRHLNMIYQKNTKVHGLDTYRFIIDPKSWNINEPENCGYCRQLPRDMYGRQKGSYCLPNGLLDISGCQQKNTKIIISNPHFFNADPTVREMFPYLTQDENLHQTTIDILPTTGTALFANKRVQINYLIKNYPGTSFKSIPSGAYPFVWVNESFRMDEHTYKVIKKNVLDPQHLAKLLCYIIGVGLGSFLMVLSVILTWINFRFYSKNQIKEWM